MNLIKHHSRSIVLLIAFFVVSGSIAADEKSPPNFLVIFIDDMGYGDLSCYGNTEVKTPRIDGLAEEGTRFTSFYAQAVCGPSRGALMTGREAYRVGGGWQTNAEEVFISEILKDAGYTTACIGKWDMSKRRYQEALVPNSQGFDYFYGALGANDRNKTTLWENRNELRTTENMADLTKLLTDKSIEFLEKNKDEPFFLYLSQIMMHVVIDASPKFRDSTGKGLYADTLAELDSEVGRLLDKLKELGLAENTLVLFLSDNGPWSNDHKNQHRKNAAFVEWTKGPEIPWGSPGQLRGGKAETWEGGMRVPGIVRWPGHVPKGRENSAIISSLDILPTFAALAGVPEKVPKDRIIDGVDQSQLLLGKTEIGARNELRYYFREELQAVRQGPWKLRLPGIKALSTAMGNIDPGTQEAELYNLENDIGETTNLADKHPEIVARLLKAARNVE
ncbi:MAG: sulfatase [Akkermansiaceae bacterium]